jgi:hypothetical protein
MNLLSAAFRGCLSRNSISCLFIPLVSLKSILMGSMILLKMQIVVPLFFRYFDVEVDNSLTAKDIKMKEAFSGCFVGEKIVLNFRRSIFEC